MLIYIKSSSVQILTSVVKVSESEYGSPVKKRRGFGNIKELMKLTRLIEEEFVTSEDSLVEQNINGPECKCKKMCTAGMFTSNNRGIIINTVYSGRLKNKNKCI